MNYLDNKMLFELYDELDAIAEERKRLHHFYNVPEGSTIERRLQELEEEEYYIRMKIEELSIVQDDYSDFE